MVRISKRLGALAASGVTLFSLMACTTQGSSGGDASPGEGGGSGDLAAVKIALVPGGAHPYFQPWKDGAADAVEEFGLGEFTFNETGEWDQTKQNSAIDSLAAQGYDAFGIFGVSPTDINSTFESLKEQGFAVASLASCPAGGENKADFCLSTDTGEAAYLAAKAAIEAMGGEGSLVHLTGNAVDSNTQLRIAGVERAVGETGGKVTLLQTITDVDKDLQTAQKAVDDLLAARGSEVTGIVTTAYNPAVAATQGVTQSGLPIKVIAIDDDDLILQAIRDGKIEGTVAQNPYGQGYIGAWALANLKAGVCTVNEPGVIVDSGSFLVTTDNVETYNDERLAKTQELLDQFQNEYFSCS